MHQDRWIDRSWVLFWAVVSTIWCLTASPRLSATFDEPHYLKQGMHAWRSGSNHMLLRGGTMPLPMHVQLFPVFIWEQVRGRPFDLASEFGTVLQTARAGNLIFWWGLLYFSWSLAARFGGVWAGRLAVPLIACDPNYLAHATLATTDIAIAAWTVLFLELYLGTRGCAWRLRVGVPGICFGLGLLAKASALPFAVLMMGGVELCRLRQDAPQRPSEANRFPFWARWLWGQTRAFRFEFWQIFGIGMAFAFLYCGCDWRADNGFKQWASQLPPGPIHDVIAALANNLCLFPNAGVGLVYQIQHNYRGHGAYIIGQWYSHSVWYYFPLALTMKLTLPVLALFAATLFARPKSYAHALGLLAVVFFVFTLNCRVQIGIRLILPFITLLLISIAVAAVSCWPRDWSTRFRPLGIGAVCLLLAAPMLSNWPNGLCYFNRLWGGPEDGYRYLSDSNYDWGQGIEELHRWQEGKGGAPLKIWYYGADPRPAARGELASLHTLPIKDESDLCDLVHGKYLAVSTTLLYSNPLFTPSAVKVLEVLKQKKPVDRTMTFFIYDFTEPTALVAAP